jgi:dGTPase
MVKDLIKNTIKNLKDNKIKLINEVYNMQKPVVCFSNNFSSIEKEIRFFLRTKMYNNKNVLIKNNKGKKIIKDLFMFIKKKPNRFLTKDNLKKNKLRSIADFISGMTDRFAINLHKNI